MNDFERINAPRVQKIIDMLEVIGKSARSNKVSDEETADLLKPIAQRMDDNVGGDTPVEAEPTPKTHTSNGTRIPQWASVREMAEQADLRDLTVAMLIAAERFDVALKENQG